MNQTKAVLLWLKTGQTISSMEAFAELGVTRLSSIIYTLRHRGYEIESEDDSIVNRFGKTVHFSRYKLVGQMELEEA